MTANEKASTSVRETIPTHLLSRIENEWQQMRAVSVAAPKPDLRVVSSPKSPSKS